MKPREYRARVQALLRAARQWREERIELGQRIMNCGDAKEVIQMHIDPVTESTLLGAIDALDD